MSERIRTALFGGTFNPLHNGHLAIVKSVLEQGLADEVWMMENAIYSVISPEGCASILWKDAKRAEEAADVLKLTAQDSLENDIIDEVISEENLGTEAFYYSLRDKIEAELRELSSLTMDELLEQRYQHFRKIGRPMA